MNRIKIIPFLFILCLHIQFSHGQSPDPELDSLKREINKAPNDSLKLKALMSVTLYHYGRGDFREALNATLTGRDFAINKGMEARIPRLTYNLGMLYTNLSNYDSAEYYLDKAREMSLQSGQNNVLIQVYNGLGSLASNRTNYPLALSWFFKGLELIEQPGNEELRDNLTRTYGNIGQNLVAEKQFDKGIDYLKKVIQVTDDPDQLRFNAQAHLEIFDAYMQSGQKEKAKLHLDSAAMISEQINNIQIATVVANHLGYYYRETGDYAKAIPALKRAASLCDSTGNEYLQSNVFSKLASVYLALNDLAEAKKFALLAKDLALRLTRWDVLAEVYEVLHQAAAKSRDYSSAYTYALLHKQYSDSTSNENTKKNILGLESRYQAEKKEKQIGELQLTNARNALTIVKRNRLLLIGGLSAISLLILLVLLVRNQRQKRFLAEKEKELKQQQIDFLHQQQQVVSLQSMINGQETERSRIAKDLHDGLGGLFSTIKMHFSTLQHENAGLKEDPLFAKSYDMINTASEEVRRIAHNMMPEVLIKLGLVQATRELCISISGGKLLQVALQAYGMEKRLNSSTEIMLFRILQELLNNIIKHAQATEAIIQFNREGNRLTVTVEDNGRGFSLAETDGKTHAGLSSVESRVSYLNGTLSIDSQKEVGTTVLMDFLINE